MNWSWSLCTSHWEYYIYIYCIIYSMSIYITCPDNMPRELRDSCNNFSNLASIKAWVSTQPTAHYVLPFHLLSYLYQRQLASCYGLLTTENYPYIYLYMLNLSVFSPIISCLLDIYAAKQINFDCSLYS